MGATSLAGAAPVLFTKYDRRVVVVMAAKECERLMALEAPIHFLGRRGVCEVEAWLYYILKQLGWPRIWLHIGPQNSRSFC